MPSYNAVNQKTKQKQSFTCTIAELEVWQKANPDWDILCGLPLIHGGFMKIDNGFRDVLKTIKKSHPRSTIKIPAGK